MTSSRPVTGLLLVFLWNDVVSERARVTLAALMGGYFALWRGFREDRRDVWPVKDVGCAKALGLCGGV